MADKNRLAAGPVDPGRLFPGLSIDCVIIGFDLNDLHILILKWKELDMWSLPGGFIQIDEDIDTAATRILEDRTGLQLPFLRQFHTFGKVNRRRLDQVLENIDASNTEFKELMPWLKQRFVSIGYLSLVDMRKSHPTPDLFSDQCIWKPIHALPELIFDHNTIVKKAEEQIRNQINYLPVGISLLPPKFTMKDLQQLYESILQLKLDRANFQKKMLKLGILNRHEKLRLGGTHKAPYLYSFNQERYNELLEKGIGYLS